MMTGPDSDPIPIKDLRDIVRMNAIQSERRHSTFVLRVGPKYFHPGTSSNRSSAYSVISCSCAEIASIPSEVR